MIRKNDTRNGAWRLLCLSGVGLALLTLATVARAQGGDVNVCDTPGDIPDVIVGEMHELNRNGTFAGKTAYSVGTFSCNPGTCWLDWFENSTRHPVIGSNMYRLKNGRFEQIGQSWLKHGFFALSETLCGACNSTNGSHLGVMCADPYTAGLNGQQSNLGPKYEVNPATGLFIWPFGTRGVTGNAIYKRLQVANTDLDVAQNPNSKYYVESTYLFPDDAPLPDGLPDGNGDGIDDYDQVDNSYNNSSHRRITIGAAPNYTASFAAGTVRELPALYAWQDASQNGNANVLIKSVEVPNDGRFFVGSLATDNGNGTWHYEYAVYNHTSNRAGASFSVPIPYGANITNIGFHDVDYHSQNTDGSGSYYEGTDWTHNGGANYAVTWTMPAGTPNRENALRWLTLYNFRFDADVAPTSSTGVIGLYLPGSPDFVETAIVAPAACDNDLVCDPGEDQLNCATECSNQGNGGGVCGDGTCNAGESSCTCLRDCGAADAEEFSCNDGDDNDCDGLVDCTDSDCCSDGACSGPDTDGDGYDACDCNSSNPNVWTPPGEVESLFLDHQPGTGTTLSWDPPVEPGGTLVSYEAIRSQNRTNFLGSTLCLSDPNPADTTLLDASANPAAGAVYYYEVRGQNACPAGEGPLGRDSNNIPRQGRTCP